MASAWRIKERLDWIRLAKTHRAARWRITWLIDYARELIGESELLEPVHKVLATLENHAGPVVRRWTSTYTNHEWKD
ncbi:MAG TPA: hypothetical protein ENJ84_11460 [Gammaproteobacteria bacterium]|nr:hypothetical protein [Gammaproteobacteria bacterium]